jgi:hypothetical protein
MNSADPLRELLRRLLADQRKRWESGGRILVEAYCRKYRELQSSPEGLLDLIYNEVFLRECRGEAPKLEEYVQRFPSLAVPLRMQFEVHQAIQPEALIAGNAPPREVPGRDGPATVFLLASKTGERIPLRETVTLLGRALECDIVLKTGEVSRRHCRIVCEQDRLMVEDLDSAQGTRVNGKRVTRSRLQDGDRLEVAKEVFQVFVSRPAG